MAMVNRITPMPMGTPAWSPAPIGSREGLVERDQADVAKVNDQHQDGQDDTSGLRLARNSWYWDGVESFNDGVRSCLSP